MSRIKCSICNKDLPISIAPKQGATSVEGWPLIVKGGMAITLGVVDGTKIWRHKDGCGPGTKIWIKLFGQSEISKSLGMIANPDNKEEQKERVQRETKDRVYEQFKGRIKYMLYMDSRIQMDWSLTYRQVTVSNKGGVHSTKKGDVNKTMHKSSLLDYLNQQ